MSHVQRHLTGPAIIHGGGGAGLSLGSWWLYLLADDKMVEERRSTVPSLLTSSVSTRCHTTYFRTGTNSGAVEHAVVKAWRIRWVEIILTERDCKSALMPTLALFLFFCFCFFA